MRWHLARYRWDIAGLPCSGSAAIETIRRALAIRRAPPQGPARRQAELAGAERIAARLAHLLRPEITTVCVTQSLLPFLWRDGHLGGREVEVLMTRLPMAELQARLDAAFEAHPERTTLGDFRAPSSLVEAESEALAYASRIVTPHAEIADLFADRATRLEWRLPTVTAATTAERPRRIAFAGPTIARKGAYAVRTAAQALGLEVVGLGSELEGGAFWSGIAMTKPPPGTSWLDGVAAIVQPAIVEERPRALLTALAAGIPVIASPACGLPEQPGVTLVPPDDATALIDALRPLIA
jgi:hypothetical protein